MTTSQYLFKQAIATPGIKTPPMGPSGTQRTLHALLHGFLGGVHGAFEGGLHGLEEHGLTGGILGTLGGGALGTVAGATAGALEK